MDLGSDNFNLKNNYRKKKNYFVIVSNIDTVILD